MKLLVLGGCRSGKSRYAEELAQNKHQRKCYVATLRATDDLEMQKRVALHRQMRGTGWQTIEEPIEIKEVLKAHQYENDVFVVDCITMWITNMVCNNLADESIEEEVRTLVNAFDEIQASVIFVANEVGLGIVPESSMGRRFRDLAGWTNQQLSQACDKVVFVAAGLPMVLKQP